MTTRREFFVESGFAAAVLAGWAASSAAADERDPAPPPGSRGRVITPDGITLAPREVDGAKVFHLVAEPVRHTFTPGLVGECWGYNGRVHGPTLEATEGDRVRIFVTNRLEEPTSVHWHGIHLPCGMDGVSGLTQRPIEPGETFRYEFTLHQHGTFMYHSHFDEMTQMALGLMGLFVVHPRAAEESPPDRDYAYMLSEWSIRPGTRRPDPNEMTDFDVLTFNAKVFPGSTPMVARKGERVRIRIGNLSAMSHHPIHLHGNSFQVVATDGGTVPLSARWPETTVLVPVGSTRTIELVADYPGDWAMHCHMTHHTMTQMGHGIPNLAGVDPSVFDEALARVVPDLVAGSTRAGASPATAVAPENSVAMLGTAGPHGIINMGGMFTVLKVRERLEEGTPVGWYEMPPGTQAEPATDDERRALGLPD